MPPLLESSSVSKAIGGLLILNHLSVSVQPGEALGVLGPNGAGKTTIFGCAPGISRLGPWLLRKFSASWLQAGRNGWEAD